LPRRKGLAVTDSRPTKWILSIVALLVLGISWFGMDVDNPGRDPWSIGHLRQFCLRVPYYSAIFAFLALFCICTCRAFADPPKHHLAGVLFGLFPLWCAAVLWAAYQVFLAVS
jgi:hypothetical protein